MATLNSEKVLAACPQLNEVQLDGVNDYKSVQQALVKANIKPTNKMVWACIEMLQESNQVDPMDFFD